MSWTASPGPGSRSSRPEPRPGSGGLTGRSSRPAAGSRPRGPPGAPSARPAGRGNRRGRGRHAPTSTSRGQPGAPIRQPLSSVRCGCRRSGSSRSLRRRTKSFGGKCRATSSMRPRQRGRGRSPTRVRGTPAPRADPPVLHSRAGRSWRRVCAPWKAPTGSAPTVSARSVSTVGAQPCPRARRGSTRTVAGTGSPPGPPSGSGPLPGPVSGAGSSRNSAPASAAPGSARREIPRSSRRAPGRGCVRVGTVMIAGRSASSGMLGPPSRRPRGRGRRGGCSPAPADGHSARSGPGSGRSLPTIIT